MKLIYTPRSHFSRKVRILVDAWGVDVELVDAGNVAAHDPNQFGGHPLLAVPTLQDGDTAVYDSDHIAHYLHQRFDPEDRFRVVDHRVDSMNARAIMNGIMTAEVQVILAERTGIDTTTYERFAKLRAVIARGLDWLEARSALFEGPATYAGFHLTAMWDHLALYDVVPLAHPGLQNHVDRLRGLPFVARSQPKH